MGRIESLELKLPLDYYLNEHNDDKSYYTLVTFSYKIENTHYISQDKIEGPYINKYRFDESDTIINNFLKKYPIGGKIRILYDPRDYKNSIIIDDSNPYKQLMIGFIVIAFIVGVIGLFFLLTFLFEFIENVFHFIKKAITTKRQNNTDKTCR